MHLRPLIIATLIVCWSHDPASSQDILFECLDSGNFCSDSSGTVIDASCGESFYVYPGRIAFRPVLTNTGPVTISARTVNVGGNTIYPVFIEIAPLQASAQDCSTAVPGLVVLMAQGSRRCGGTWESIGPIDLERFLVPQGTQYQIQAVFFEKWLGDFPFRQHSAGLACVRVTQETPPTATTVTSESWTNIKALYR